MMYIAQGLEASIEQNGNYPGQRLIHFAPHSAPYNGNHNHMLVSNPEISPSSSTISEGKLGRRKQDSYMPVANIIRIMQRGLPPHAKIADDVKDIIQECLSEFLSFITGEANERCKNEQRKTITAEDIVWSMAKLGFDDYVEPLTVYLKRYREIERGQAALRKEFIPIQKRNLNYGVFPTVAASSSTGPRLVAAGATAVAPMHMAPMHMAPGLMLGLTIMTVQVRVLMLPAVVKAMLIALIRLQLKMKYCWLWLDIYIDANKIISREAEALPLMGCSKTSIVSCSMNRLPHLA
ncbi:hypothetical protein Dimus_019225 [Dionaea muscipula]